MPRPVLAKHIRRPKYISNQSHNPLKSIARVRDYLMRTGKHSTKCCVIAIGNGGAHILEAITKDKTNYHTLSLYTDFKPSQRLFASRSRVLNRFVRAHRHVYLLSTLGKQCQHTRSILQVAKHLKALDREVSLILIKPFDFELQQGREICTEDAIKEIKKHVSQLYLFNNQDLVNHPQYKKLPIGQAWKFLNLAIATVIERPPKHIQQGVTHPVSLITVPIYNLKLDAGDFVHNQGRF